MDRTYQLLLVAAAIIGLYLSGRQVLAPILDELKELGNVVDSLSSNVLENTVEQKYTHQQLSAVVQQVVTLEEQNRAAHKRLWSKNEEQDNKLSDHEHRLITIENEVSK